MVTQRRASRPTRGKNASESGDQSAAELLPRVYGELRRLSSRYLRRYGRSNALQTTALVHEAFLKLARRPTRIWRGDEHFTAVTASAMRQVLVDHAREAHRLKRGGGARPVTLPIDVIDSREGGVDLLELNEALDRLRAIDEDLVKLVELRLFAGVSPSAAAKILGISQRTLERDWALARAWLRRELASE